MLLRPLRQCIARASTSAVHQSIRRKCIQSMTHMEYMKARDVDNALYTFAGAMFATGVSFAAVPLYRIFCRATGLGGTSQMVKDFEKIERMTAIDNRLIKITFTADTNSSMRWQFRPQQSEIWVNPGETALAFYTATNPTSVPVIGISTYNIIPYEAGLYFAKIQCFCFEEQVLNPGETVDMPVFFYIDPDFVDDPRLEYCDDIILSYTFFEAKEGLKLPQPLTQHRVNSAPG